MIQGVRHAIPFLILAILLAGCGSSLELNSRWKNQEIKVDGTRDDWQGRLTYIEKEDISIGLSNDEHYVYICLSSIDQNLQRQMLLAGFTVWFDPDGGKDKTLGIRFPIGMRGLGLSGRRWGQQMDPERLQQMYQMATHQLEILGPAEGQYRRATVSELKGLEVKLSGPLDVMVYEIKVPLRINADFEAVLNVGPDAIIGMGFETTRMERGSNIGGVGRRGGGFGGAGSPRRSSQLQIWATVQLDPNGVASIEEAELEENRQPTVRPSFHN